MAIDVRATVTCSLGTLISGNIADGYIQGNGLVLVRGSVEINGLITPAVGTAVTFAYKINGGTRNIPRKLRVLSSFADPFRRTTKVELGCKLTYLSDLREQLKWSAFDDPENLIDYDPGDYEVIPIPTRAASMMDRCLTELGITASSNPLTNKFSTGQYDFSSGWVNVLGELLVSEGYCGYLDRNEVLQVFALNQDGGTGPVVGRSELIDIGAINAGQLPGEAVVVNYSALKLSQVEQPIDWTKSKSSNRGQFTVVYTQTSNGAQASVTYGTLDTSEEYTDYQTLTVSDGKGGKQPIEVVRYRKVITTQTAPMVLGSATVQLLEANFNVPSGQIARTTETWYTYDAYGVEIRSEKVVTSSYGYAWGQSGLPVVIYEAPLNNAGGFYQNKPVGLDITKTFVEERVVTETVSMDGYKKVVVYKYGPWAKTIAGQQCLAEARPSFTTTAQVERYFKFIYVSGQYLLGIDVSTQQDTSRGQGAPVGSSKYIQPASGAAANSSNSQRSENKSEVVLVLGSATAQRRIEFTLPMAPDDVFIKSGGGYSIVPNNAYNKAKAYGIIQNRLLLGNRNGMNLRLNAIQMPEAPFSPLVVSVNDAAALYRTNATSWTFSAEGLVVSTDALFWGAVGGTGTPWFPVAPGVTTLPSLPSTSTVNVTGTADGGGTVTIGTISQLTVGGVVAPYNETSLLAPTVRAGLVVSSYPYSLVAVVTSVPVVTRAKADMRRTLQLQVSVVDIVVAAQAPRVAIGVRVLPPVGAINAEALVPRIASGACANVPSVELTVAGLVPQLVGRLKTVIDVPAANVALASVAPAGIGGRDPSFSSVSLLLHMDGSNNSTTFTDKSNAARTVTAYGNAKISTTQSKIGGASSFFDGTGDYLSVPYSTAFDLGTGDFTIETWFHIAGNSALNNDGVRPAALFSCYPTGNPANGYFLQLEGSSSTTGTKLLFFNVVSSVFYSIEYASTISQQTWHHVAVVRNGTTTSIYLNGTSVASGTLGNQNVNAGSNNFVVGRLGFTGYLNEFNGYIDELRITKGVARYTAAFTPSTTAFPDA